MTAKISRKTKFGFGAGEFSSSIFFTIISFWLMNFLTDEVGLSAALAGTALLVGKIWDALIDPFIGHFSGLVTYGWGVIPVHVRIGKTEWQTSLFPKDGRYLVPLKDSVRKAENLDEGDNVTIQLEVRL